MFWDRMGKLLENKNLTIKDFSNLIEVNPSVVDSWKNRGVMPRADVACKAAKVLNTSVEYLISGDRSVLASDYIVPVLNQELSAGKGSLLPDEDVIQGLVALPSYLREYGENLAGLYVHGDSMQPTLNNGDMVICTSLGWDNSEGLYAIRLNGNGYVKRIQVGAGKIIINSDNPKYKPIEESLESDNLQIIGKVVLIIQKV